jgi:hypothetical protein
MMILRPFATDRLVPTLSCITTCKSRLDQLKLTLPRMMAIADAEVVVVDYDCPQGAAEWVRASHPAARVVKVEGRTDFHLANARNLGAAAATAPWLAFIDCDTLVAPALAESLAPLLAPGAFFIPRPRPPTLWGALVVARADFDKIEGYDEAFEGWGSEDEDILERLEEAGLRPGDFPGDLLGTIDHGNALRTRHYEVKDPNANNCINYLYRQAKRDLARNGGKPTLAERRLVYGFVKSAFLNPKGGSIQIGYRESTLAGRRLIASLRYEIAGSDAAGGGGADGQE